MIADLIARIKSNCPSVKTVTGPVTEAVLERLDLPTVFVYPTADSMGREFGSVALVQSRFSVEIISELPTLQRVKSEIRAALSEFNPLDARTPLRFTSGRLEKIDGSRLTWIDIWECATCLTGA